MITQSQLRVQSAARTDRGLRRQNNEDSYFVDDALGLYIVCDGLGGHAAGEFASNLAIELTIAYLLDRWQEVERFQHNQSNPDELSHLLVNAICYANEGIQRVAEGNTSMLGMATTLTLAMIANHHVCVAHVGDSRLYMQRKGRFIQLTTDHTLENEYHLQNGKLASAIFPNPKALMRCVGGAENVRVDTQSFIIQPNDTLLLCSDGLSDYFDDSQAVADLLSCDSRKTVDSLVNFANDRGGKDNITAVVINFPADSVSDEDAISSNVNGNAIRKRPIKC